LILLSALLAFQPALHNRLTQDDVQQVQELSVPHDGAGWMRAAGAPWWPPARQKHLWRPLTRLSILAQKEWCGAALWSFYGFNILLHAAVALLLFAVAGRLGLRRGAAGAAALLFAVHPVHAEAVHQVVGRAELFAAAFMLIGFLAFLKLGLKNPHTWWIQPLLFAGALGAKEHAIVYPALLLLAALAAPSDPDAPRRRWAVLGQRRFWGLMLVLGAVGAGFVGFRAAITGGILEPVSTIPYHENPLAHLPFWSRLPASLGVFGYAVSRLFWPAGLSPDYSAVSFPFGRGWAWAWSWIGLAGALAILGYGIMNYRRGGRGWLLATAGAIGYGLIANGPLVIGVDLAERLWYWPSAAACLALGWGVGRVDERLNPGARRTAVLGFGLALVLLISAAWADAPAWRSPKDYALATLRRFPQSWRAHVNLARENYLEKDFERGAQQARQATSIFPNLAIGWDWLGVNAMFLPGDEREAEAALRRALALDPSLGETHRHLANLLERLGRKAEAARELEAYLKFSEIADRSKVAERLERLQRQP